MVDIIWKSKSWLSYFIKRKDEFSLHSPFVFDLYSYLKEDVHFYSFELIEEIRAQQSNNNTFIPVYDLGAGSTFNSYSKEIKVSEVTTNAAIPHKYGKILFKLINKFQPENIIEIGTSTGISTLYLSLASSAPVITIEGNPALVKIAKANFENADCKNITSLTGDFTDQLPIALDKLKKIDFAFVDGNHQLEPTINYFNQLKEKAHPETIMIFDDIHWSGEMEYAWQQIINDNKVTLSIDLFRMGIVFFRKALTKQHYILKF